MNVNVKSANCGSVGFNYGTRPDCQPPLEFLTEKFIDSAIEIRSGSDIPDQLPEGLLWSDLTMLIYPGARTTPMFRTPGCKEEFTKHDTWIYLQAFFIPNKPEILWLHVWKSRILEREELNYAKRGTEPKRRTREEREGLHTNDEKRIIFGAGAYRQHN